MFTRKPVFVEPKAEPKPEPGLDLNSLGIIDLDDLQADPLRNGLALWRLKKGERLFPSREDMSPRALGGLLRNVVLVKVLDEGHEFEIRIVGDVIASMQEIPIQGLRTREIDEILPGFGHALRQIFVQISKNKTAMALRGKVLRNIGIAEIRREIVLLPLGETDEAVDHILILMVYNPPEFSTAA